MKKFTKDSLGKAAIHVLLCFITSSAMAQLPRYHQQQEKNNEGTVMTVNILFGGHLTVGDLADRFGSHASTGLGIDFVTSKDWVVGTHGVFYFGSKVKEDVISSLRDPNGLIFGANGDLSAVGLKQRGIQIEGHLGKIFRINQKRRSGIRATIGGSFYQHKVRIQDDPVVAIPQLSKEYKRGYDRLSNGFGLTQFIGYQHLGKMRRANFIIGLELTEAFTQNRRNFNFDTRSEDTASRFDMIYGFRIAWMLPFYLGENAEDIRY